MLFGEWQYPKDATAMNVITPGEEKSAGLFLSAAYRLTDFSSQRCRRALGPTVPRPSPFARWVVQPCLYSVPE